MKKIFSRILILALLLNTSVFFANSLDFGKTSMNQFLDNYYSKSYSFGKSIETKANNQNIIVSELLDKTNGIINGYVAVNKENNELLYFIDYKRESQEIKAIDFINNITDIISLKKDNKFEIFVEIDLIKEIEKVNISSASAMKFWGTSCGGGWTTPTGECYKTCCYYIFWMESGCDVVGC
ncbi:hypothetical protein FNW25_00560 [Flavobacterium franklandianum]|uniref:Uncharacterized protein n=1 Tax=Flavobacterium franklandianum TaxID=2594430 RepID=A0A553CLL4_9FLAO|nr:hypothetical protein [Flavobacterium franklandianum]TRX21337.1 hypothetical protein FNW17_08250 [Flavobacterium franklandianum]TRX30021.1 hypothetical protein FNW25_00560 [Flavobacterium franklandianum]